MRCTLLRTAYEADFLRRLLRTCLLLTIDGSFEYRTARGAAEGIMHRVSDGEASVGFDVTFNASSATAPIDSCCIID